MHSLNKGSCVLGVQDATTTLFRFCSFTAFLMLANPVSEHVYKLSSACETFGKFFAYSANALQSINPPIFVPQ